MENKELYYLRDSRSDCGSSAMFWALKGGYTTDLNKAEKFTRKKAVNQYKCRETDIPLRCDLIDPLSYLAVDSQYLNEEYEPDPKGEYVAQIKGKWDGNNICFFSENRSIFKNETYNLLQCELFGPSNYKPSHLVMLPKSEMDKIARPVIDSQKIDTLAFLKAAKIKVIKTKKVRQTTGKTRHNCPKCHKFVWSYNPYDAEQCHVGKCRFL